MVKLKKQDNMKKQLERYKAWRLEKIKAWGQWYADFIVTKIEDSNSEFEVNFWMLKGIMHDNNMIDKYNIYLN